MLSAFGGHVRVGHPKIGRISEEKVIMKYAGHNGKWGVFWKYYSGPR
jgi:hypothetical protein